MYKRLAIYVLLAAAVAAVLLMKRPGATEPRAQVAATTDAESPARYEDPVQLAPDRRALLAVGEIHRLIRGHAGGAAEARFAGGRWHVFLGSNEIGTLPEYPDFDDLMAFLAREAGSLGSVPAAEAPAAQRAEVEAALARFDPIRALLALDRAWKSGPHDPALHRDAARALVALTAQTTDLVGAADRVPARALAELAVCRASGLAGLESDEALLADRMGYSAHAWSLAERLPESEPIRRFVRHEDAALASLADDPATGEVSRFLELSRRASNHDDNSYFSWVRRYYPAESTLRMPVLATMLSLGSFDTQVASAAIVLLAIENDLKLHNSFDAAVTTNQAPGLGTVVRHFEQTMADMKVNSDGEWLDRDLLQAYYRAAFYSALWRLGEFERQSLSSLSGTRDLANEWSHLPPGPAEEFGRWYTHLAGMKLGHPDPLALKNDLVTLPSFGSQLRFATFDACAQTPIGRFRGVRPQARLLLGQLDSRPDDRLRTMEVLREHLMDLVGAESLLASAARTASPVDPAALIWWATMAGDPATIDSLLGTPGLGANLTNWALSYRAAMSDGDSTGIRAAYARAIAEYPGSAALVLSFDRTEWNRFKRVTLARSALRAWLARNPDNDGLDRVAVTTALARGYQREHHYRQALDLVLPVADSQKEEAMALAAQLLDDCGRGTQAESLAAFTLHRYPDSYHALTALAGMLWRHRRYDEAAAALRDSRYHLDDAHWFTYVAPEFADRFADRPEEAMDAVAAIERAGLNTDGKLGCVARELHRRGRSDLAFQVEQHVDQEGQDAATRIIASYKFATAARGRGAADAWLQGQMAGAGEHLTEFLGSLAFGEGEPRMLWTIEPKSPAGNSFQWLLRAAASPYETPGNPEHQEALRRHYAAPGTEHYYVLGRYVLGLEPESSALAQRVTPRAACEVYFYIGYRAQAEGRYADAARWYERCVATGESRNGEYYWANAQLTSWAAKMRTLGSLEAADRVTRRAPSISALGFQDASLASN